MPAYSWRHGSLTNGDLDTPTDQTVTDDEYRLVAYYEPPEGIGFAPGEGESGDLDVPGTFYLDANNDGGSNLAGEAALVVLNPRNHPVDQIYGNDLSSLRTTGEDNEDGVDFPYQGVRVKHPYKLGLMIQLDSGSDTAAVASFKVDGFKGQRMD